MPSVRKLKDETERATQELGVARREFTGLLRALQANEDFIDELVQIRQAQKAIDVIRRLTSEIRDASGKAVGLVENIRSTEDGRIKAHNVVRGKKDAARLKRWPGGPPPFGFRLKAVVNESASPPEVYNVLEHEPRQAAALRLAFERAAATGEGDLRLTQWWNRSPDVLDDFKPVSPFTMGYRLENPIAVGTLPNNGAAHTLTFPAKTATSLQLNITAVSGTTTNVGLAEIQVYNTTAGPAPSQPPVANAGANQAVTAGAAVQLDGSGSTPAGGTLTYNWSQTAGPAVTLSSSTTVRPTRSAARIRRTSGLGCATYT